MGVQIRRAGVADAAALVRCIDAAYAPYRAGIRDLPDVSHGVAQDIRDALVWVAMAEGDIVGGLILVLTPDHAHLRNVAVHPDHGGKGIARALIETAEAAARHRGFADMRLATHVDMPGNVRLYEHLGWTETGREGNRVMMAKTLPRG